jgi:hypothetical protein
MGPWSAESWQEGSPVSSKGVWAAMEGSAHSTVPKQVCRPRVFLFPFPSLSGIERGTQCVLGKYCPQFVLDLF